MVHYSKSSLKNRYSTWMPKRVFVCQTKIPTDILLDNWRNWYKITFFSSLMPNEQLLCLGICSLRVDSQNPNCAAGHVFRRASGRSVKGKSCTLIKQILIPGHLLCTIHYLLNLWKLFIWCLVHQKCLHHRYTVKLWQTLYCTSC